MPIEIRELVIKATVGQNEEQSTAAVSGGGASNNVGATEEIINTCVEKIIELLKEKNER